MKSAKARLSMLCLAIGFLLSACVAYTYNSETYHSTEAAYAAQQRYQEQTLQHISPAPQVNSGKAIILIPSRETIEALGIKRRGSPPKEYIDYLVHIMSSEYACFPKYLEASRAFSAVESRVVDHPAVEARQIASNYAATIYLDMLSPDQAGWFLMKPDGGAPIEIHFDGTAARGAPKIDSWIKSVVGNANGGAKP